ncbi:MAG: hypothetical protein JHC26_10420 [Thermofilum sp.]|jgi:hypothetical protein|uniref:hypothetical protein n=1 Tax=Thermofilum sp. TaxID=1961369 RepID=UPI002584925A|nr:hypothetical protein [Thermofilum sp.]MCI4409494.1 hypothetical protein [Thermofilum sp.]
MSQEEKEIKVNGDEKPRTIEEVARYIAKRLDEELDKIKEYRNTNGSVVGNLAEIWVGFYFDSMDEKRDLDESVEDFLKRINEEDMKEIRGEINTEWFSVYFTPKICEGIHCFVGMRAVIKFNKSIDEITYKELDRIVNVIKDVYLL